MSMSTGWPSNSTWTVNRIYTVIYSAVTPVFQVPFRFQIILHSAFSTRTLSQETPSQETPLQETPSQGLPSISMEKDIVPSQVASFDNKTGDWRLETDSRHFWRHCPTSYPLGGNGRVYNMGKAKGEGQVCRPRS